MSLAERGTVPDEPSDRGFGLWGATLLAAWSLWPIVRGQPEAVRWVPLALSCAVAVVAAVRPSLVGPVHRAARWLTRPLRAVSQAIVLGATYFLLVTPVALLRRWFGRSPVELRIDGQARSYWVQRADAPPPDFRLPF